ncbi:class I SAM-dependent methyltransferase [Streptomyces mirabilis]|uniref:class I SAM-dependent methyltransferase n=1 Tax=Streptomyces mirabilis TaxID=68239 RepID=UPI001BAF3A2A|nr:class I SAM-dependent methyltransferase [Streptomyces mirabilis]QUW80428.1 class I SAM-dependent methyltransferase [Streptomyces mirabilis]
MTTHPRFSHTTRAHSFNTAAAQYAANRPSYPPALFTTLEDLAARPLKGAKVIDVGAGTGIATTLLHARGADVIAVEPGEGMAAEFRRAHPDIPLVRGTGDTLPLATASADFLTYAQSWHWTNPARSLPEAFRVLRPGGALALWWNTSALDVPWIAAQSQRIDQYFEDAHPTEEGTAATKAKQGAATKTEEDTATKTKKDTESHQRTAGFLTERAFKGAPELPPHTHRIVRWSRHVPVDTHLANIGSHSAFLVLGKEDTDAFLAEERTRLLETFPDGRVEEVYEVLVIVATRS